MRIFALAAALVAALLVPAGNAAHAQSRTIEVGSDPYIHKSVKVAFPAQVGPFTRGRVVEFSDDGADASVGYQMEGMANQISIYVYPANGQTCAGTHDGAQEAIFGRDGTLRANAPEIFMPGFELAEQISSTYDVPAGGYGFDHPQLVSYLWVGCVPGGEWFVKYRGSFFASQHAAAKGIAENLFRQIDWKPLAKVAR